MNSHRGQRSGNSACVRREDGEDSPGSNGYGAATRKEDIQLCSKFSKLRNSEIRKKPSEW